MWNSFNLKTIKFNQFATFEWKPDLNAFIATVLCNLCEQTAGRKLLKFCEIWKPFFKRKFHLPILWRQQARIVDCLELRGSSLHPVLLCCRLERIKRFRNKIRPFTKQQTWTFDTFKLILIHTPGTNSNILLNGAICA